MTVQQFHRAGTAGTAGGALTEDALAEHAFVDDAFAEVARAFEENFAAGAEVGAAVCVYHRGRPVVDLWAGWADPDRTDPWRAGTLGVLASPTKALVTAAFLHLAERDGLDLDEPVAEVWPEFAAHGKAGITPRMILSHRSGVVCLDHAPLTLAALRAHTPVAEALAAARPEWEPGTAHGYHATTYGHLLSELIRRRTGLTAGRYFARHLAGPLGLDAHIGLPDGAGAHLATMLESKAEALMAGADPGEVEELREPSTLTYRATIGSMSQDPADPAVEDPSYGGLASAHALARLFAALVGEVDGIRLIGPERTAELARPHSGGPCKVMLTPLTWGLGVQLADSAVFPADAGLKNSFGLSGANGVFTFADPERELAFGYVPNMGSSVMGSMDGRIRRLVEAVFRSVDRIQ
ncbi:beta-lactamase family protein [Streptomyces sp. BR123]|uniref:serine hydrolase domain-containing protein n=1 Tax=Streptomyces sp. BR123 TaxID=2749828 RepID=UPI0015C4A835|nr:serine hydrolase domain-containing protein [Streptomyces sp. BR123]NXY97066.1 beta-lactamase family protein [Streptomyces sp. BR123]